MNSGIAASAEAAAKSQRSRWRSNLGRLGRSGLRFLGWLRREIFEEIADGRLRDRNWPYGLRAIVGVGYAMFAVAGLVVVFAGLVRSRDTLTVGPFAVTIPSSAVWLIVALLAFALAAFMTAALHGPVWLKLMALVSGTGIVGIWSLLLPGMAIMEFGLGGSLVGIGWVLLGLVATLALGVFVLLRWRRAFAWWELAVLWGLVGTGLIVGVIQARAAKSLGFDTNALYVQLTISSLADLVLPAAMVAGAAVADITVRATIAGTKKAERLRGGHWPYMILATVLVVRTIQVVLDLSNRDVITGGPVTILPALVLAFALGIVGAVLLKISRRRRRRHAVLVQASALRNELTRVAFVVAAALIGPAMAFGYVSFVLTFTRVDPAIAIWVSTGFGDPLRVALGAVLIGLAVRAAWRQRPGQALILGCIGVLLVAWARNLVLGNAPVPIDLDMVNLLATLAAVVSILVAAVRRRLTGRRALAYASLLVLCGLFSARELIADPLAYLLGFPTAALLLFGLSWDLLTGSSWGNGSSKRFPPHVRVLLVLTNSVLAMTVLAYATLVRDASSTIQLDEFTYAGAFVFGTALIAAAAIAVFDIAQRDATLG